MRARAAHLFVPSGAIRHENKVESMSEASASLLVSLYFMLL